MSAATTVEGAWQTALYIVNGAATDVDGVLLLANGQWSTLYFVRGPGGLRGSAEAGSYDWADGTLTFRHRLAFQGGDGRVVVMTNEDTEVEACAITLEADTMTIRFPSGNTLLCRRI